MICLECKHYCYDEVFDTETGDEYETGYCEIGNETDGYNSKACDDFVYKKCCDTCKYYKWYYDKCSKYNCETDARARCSEYEHISELKEGAE